MIYLHDGHIRTLGIDWRRLIGIVESVVRERDRGACVSPVKTYLRYGDMRNRIIAMPAYVGGPFELAGIKWVAGFPGNIDRDLPRASNAIVLNDARTGIPSAFIRSSLLNGLRAAAVSGLMLQAYLAARQPKDVRLGIVGWGPIGRLHLDMCADLLGDRLKRATLFDLRPIDPETVPADLRDVVDIANDWRELYDASNVFATCTVSAERYVDAAPPAGALLLNVSLRDYEPGSVFGKAMPVVDDWSEVCRENTDIERLHAACGLSEADARTLADVVCRDALLAVPEEMPVFFNPMGLGVFDIAIAGDYAKRAAERGDRDRAGGMLSEMSPKT
ncbi:2,3-diaminopropionate biosynthesis protein SbnB [Cohnella rhizosphaerae]|uniref:2,3-diaminopropionate biosynthesis protein SbnB n=2 Tax=Cohnella rhizosphaerae TaxID=1457232 RepID=A0A9X4QTH3_9BACL|nr:2,3-diaminopropionate biosynthesis protein SbnB [Cohnella rhizosphaerae]MDG0809502.1 2,3-diaminopropionate biosynthesis protein SbnB [Cohnella rhizosphaerae]